MEQYKDKSCKLHVKVNDKDLFFDCQIKDVTPTHISIIDRYNKEYCFRRLEVVEIYNIRGEHNGV